MLDRCVRASWRVMILTNRSMGSPSAEQNTLMRCSYSTSIKVTNLHIAPGIMTPEQQITEYRVLAKSKSPAHLLDLTASRHKQRLVSDKYASGPPLMQATFSFDALSPLIGSAQHSKESTNRHATSSMSMSIDRLHSSAAVADTDTLTHSFNNANPKSGKPGGWYHVILFT